MEYCIFQMDVDMKVNLKMIWGKDMEGNIIGIISCLKVILEIIKLKGMEYYIILMEKYIKENL